MKAIFVYIRTSKEDDCVRMRVWEEHTCAAAEKEIECVMCRKMTYMWLTFSHEKRARRTIGQMGL